MFNSTVIMGFSRHQKAKAMREQNAKKNNTIQNENEKKEEDINNNIKYVKNKYDIL